MLIDLFGKYRKKVGTLEIRSLKQMWQVIANEIKSITGDNLNASHCENRWKVLERNYKAFVDNKRKTGRGRKIFEFSTEMDNIFHKKKNINPEIILESNTVEQLVMETVETHLQDDLANHPINETREVNTQNREVQNINSDVGRSSEPGNLNRELQNINADVVRSSEPGNPNVQKKTDRKSTLKKRNSILEDIREEKSSTMLALHTERVALERSKIAEMTRRNNLLEERNRILKENFAKDNLSDSLL